AVARWAKAYTQAATKPGQATMQLLQQVSRQFTQATGQEPPAIGGGTDDTARTTVQREPNTRPNLTGNVTVDGLVRRGVHPEVAAAAARDPRLLLAIQRDLAAVRSGTHAQEVIAQRAAQHPAIGGIG